VILIYVLFRQQVREEAQIQAFGNTGLGEGSKKKYPKVTMAKQAAKKSPKVTDGHKRYQTRAQKSRETTIDLFGGASLDELPVKKRPRL
jgi:hypothetical protein